MTTEVGGDEKQIVYKWWQELDWARDSSSYKDIRYTPFTAKESAELRRAKTIDEVIMTSTALHDLRHRLVDTKWNNIERVALIAGVLSHVRYLGMRLPEGLANEISAKRSESAINLRFRRLIQYQTANELFRPMIRHIEYVENRVDVAHLAESLFYWSEDTRKKWAILFYETVNKK